MRLKKVKEEVGLVVKSQVFLDVQCPQIRPYRPDSASEQQYLEYVSGHGIPIIRDHGDFQFLQSRSIIETGSDVYHVVGGRVLHGEGDLREPLESIAVPGSDAAAERVPQALENKSLDHERWAAQCRKQDNMEASVSMPSLTPSIFRLERLCCQKIPVIRNYVVRRHGTTENRV